MPLGSGYAHLSNVSTALDRIDVGAGLRNLRIIGMMILSLSSLISLQEGLRLPLRPPGLNLALSGSHRMTKRIITFPSVKLR